MALCVGAEVADVAAEYVYLNTSRHGHLIPPHLSALFGNGPSDLTPQLCLEEPVFEAPVENHLAAIRHGGGDGDGDGIGGSVSNGTSNGNDASNDASDGDSDGDGAGDSTNSDGIDGGNGFGSSGGAGIGGEPFLVGFAALSVGYWDPFDDAADLSLQSWLHMWAHVRGAWA